MILMLVQLGIINRLKSLIAGLSRDALDATEPEHALAIRHAIVGLEQAVVIVNRYFEEVS